MPDTNEQRVFDPSRLKMDPSTAWDTKPKPPLAFIPGTPDQLEFCWSHAGLLHLQTANKCLEKSSETPVPDMLFGEFWRKDEVCILFADTNLGKSILAVQIADSISKGVAIPGFKLESAKQPVVYFDFELSAKQFEARYSADYTNHYVFDDELIRVAINPLARVPDGRSFEEYLLESIELSIARTKSKVVIIDNITYLRDEARAGNALNLMKQLLALKASRELSVLVIAHTARRNNNRPIDRNDVQGSKTMMQYCDSAFCIGESNGDSTYRYLKQVKTRIGGFAFGANNVAVCQLVKPGNFLKFELLHFGMEWEQLKGMADETRSEMIARIVKKSAEGKTQRQIAAEVGVSLGAVNKYLKEGKAAQVVHAQSSVNV